MTLTLPESERIKRISGGNQSGFWHQRNGICFLWLPELQSDVLDGRDWSDFFNNDRWVSNNCFTAPQLPESKGKILEAPKKMTEKSESKALGEGRRKIKQSGEPMKGYMRPTKSRTDSTFTKIYHPGAGDPNAQVQWYAPAVGKCVCLWLLVSIKKAKSLCFGLIQTLIILVNRWFVGMKTCNC